MDINKLTIPFKDLQLRKLDNARSYLLYGVILFHAYHQDVIWVTNKTLASELQVTERQVQNCLKDLKDHKCIEISSKVDPKTKREIRYITPLVIGSVKYMPNNYKEEDPNPNGGFTEL